MEQFKHGQIVTVWPKVDRSIGESRDTEAGLQPWEAEVLGYLSTYGKEPDQLVIHELGDTEYKHLRIMNQDSDIKVRRPMRD